jgi:hypothetical protein
MNHAGFRAAKRSRFRAGGLLSHPGETQHHVCKCDSDRTDVTMEETEGTYRRKKTLWGILGGMGPLSSAGFLATVYRLEAASEQEMPMIILISDPDVPDRTDAIVKLGQNTTKAVRSSQKPAERTARSIMGNECRPHSHCLCHRALLSS